MKQRQTFFLYNLFALTVFLGAFLLFQVQPIIDKYILPWFGGTSFVWITSLLFFQTLLLTGYFYSFLLTRLELKKQVSIHLVFVLFAIIITGVTFFLWRSPITPGIENELPDTFPPVVQVLAILFIAVGLPYFLLSTTSTLLQRWFGNIYTDKSPYSLYALSNIGSLLGIISYPFLIEPAFKLQTQGLFWSAGYILCAFFLVASCLETLRHRAKKTSEKTAPSLISSKKYLLWFSLPAISSLMLLATTNQLTLAIAPVPFLWLLPLGLYLLSFILCFSDKKFYRRNFFAYAFFVMFLIIVSLLIHPAMLEVSIEVSLYSLLLFYCFMLCHGELYNSRPHPQYLNIFYLLIAFGSVIGGSIVVIIAPILFKGLYWELSLGLCLSSFVAAFALLYFENSFIFRLLHSFLPSKKEISLFIIFVLGIIAILLAIVNYGGQITSSKHIWRNFYGTLRITEQKTSQGTLSCLLNGIIIHGCQFTSGTLHDTPITYYGKNSGITLGVQSLRDKLKQEAQKNVRFGGIGLGVGTIAAYTRAGDYMKFYELNPLDIDVAKNYFSYLKDSPAKIETVAGDGRLSMEKELKENKKGNYNLLVIDAFNDDAIPVHLLTKEAFRIYLDHLSPTNGMIAVNISNSYINLIPVIQQLAKYYGMQVVFVYGNTEGDAYKASRWTLLSYDKKLLTTPELEKAKENVSKNQTVQLWTDDYSNIFQILHF